VENPLRKIVESSGYIRYFIMILSVIGTINGLTMLYEKYKIEWISQDVATYVVYAAFGFAVLLEYALVQAEKGMGYTRKGTGVRKAIMRLWLFYAFVNFLTMSANILVRTENITIDTPAIQSAVSVRDSFSSSYDELESEYRAKLEELRAYRSGAAKKDMVEAFEAKKAEEIAKLKEELSAEIAKMEAKRDADIAKYRARDFDGEKTIRANVAWVKRKTARSAAKLKKEYAVKIAAIDAKTADVSGIEKKRAKLEKAVYVLQTTKLSVAKQLQAANREVEALKEKARAEKESDLFWNRVYTVVFSLSVVLMNIFMSFNVGRIHEFLDGGVKPLHEEKKEVMKNEKSGTAAKVLQTDDSGDDSRVLNMIAMHLARNGKMPTYDKYGEFLGTNSRDMISKFVKNSKYILPGNIPSPELRELAKSYMAEEVAA